MYRQPLIERYESLCASIFKLDPNIRFLAVITSNGKPLVSVSRPGFVPLVDQRDGEVILTEAALILRMQHEFDPKLGKMDYLTIKRELMSILVFPLGKDAVYVSCDVGSNLLRLGEKISRRLRVS